MNEIAPGGVTALEDSYSILPALVATELGNPIREAIVHHSGNGMYSIRQGPWKLIRGLGSGGFSEPRHVEPEPGGPQGQLYTMEQDPQGTANLWLERQDIVGRLSTLLNRCVEEGRSAPSR